MNDWRALQAKFDALKPREKLMVFGAALAVVVLLLDSIVFTPGFRKIRQAESSVTALRTETSALKTQIAMLAAQKSIDPDAQAKAKAADLERRIAAVEETISSRNQLLVPPQKMPTLSSGLEFTPRMGAHRTLCEASRNVPSPPTVITRSTPRSEKDLER